MAPVIRRCEHVNRVVTYQSDLLQRVGVRHAFSTRLGGISSPPYDTMNLGLLTKGTAPDNNTDVAENFRRLRRAVGLERKFRVQVRQVHGHEIWIPPTKPVRFRDCPQADGIVTSQPQAMLTIRTADCVPILLSSDDGRVVGAVHAGWRGIVAGVLPNAVRHTTEHFGVPPERLLAAIGPCIGLEAFEVGQEVVDAFIKVDLHSVVHQNSETIKSHIDLAAAAELQLIRTGLLPESIDRTDRCTFRDATDFFSYRRDKGNTGRLAAVISAKES